MVAVASERELNCSCDTDVSGAKHKVHKVVFERCIPLSLQWIIFLLSIVKSNLLVKTMNKIANSTKVKKQKLMRTLQPKTSYRVSNSISYIPGRFRSGQVNK